MNIAIGIVIFLVIFLVIFGVWKAIFKKEEDNFSASLIASGTALILQSFPSWLDVVFQAIINKSYGSETNYVSLFIGIGLLGLGIYFQFELRKKIYILNFLGNDKKRILDKNVLKKLKYSDLMVRERELDVVRIFGTGTDIDEQKIKYICEEIKEKTETFIYESSESKRGFTGMASIPLICLAGTHFASSKVDIYFEYNRHNQNYSKLERRKFSRKYPKLKLEKLSVPDSEFEEVVISISTTARINEKDLKQFGDKPIIEIYVKHTEDNIIGTYSQLTEYALKISEEIEGVKQQNGVNKIHLVMATQSCLALEIGRYIGMNRNRFPTVIVYHYNAGNEIRYPFGIIVTEQNKGTLILP